MGPGWLLVRLLIHVIRINKMSTQRVLLRPTQKAARVPDTRIASIQSTQHPVIWQRREWSWCEWWRGPGRGAGCCTSPSLRTWYFVPRSCSAAAPQQCAAESSGSMSPCWQCCTTASGILIDTLQNLGIAFFPHTALVARGATHRDTIKTGFESCKVFKYVRYVSMIKEN